eukprot:TRINITY_DN59991_c0_g1_i1.p1 TRINITY_DN59991_c0_g1~~TRINITY_DN59991_c0_g1_i1.p1  ORF type:complete len:339 (+),score=19.11 TRINITY_DN59991_c0_g1_i1:34-1050(+)
MRPFLAALPNRTVFRIASKNTGDAGQFLQNYITADVVRSVDSYGCMLNQQGRILCDAWIFRNQSESADELLIDCDATLLAAMIKHLQRYNFRKTVTIEADNDLVVHHSWQYPDSTQSVVEGEALASLPGWMTVNDRRISPRQPTGQRWLVPKSKFDIKQAEECFQLRSAALYHRYRYLHGICEGAQGLPTTTALPFESNMDIMTAINFKKGCYLGQELTARTKYRGVTRKRVVPVVLGDRSLEEATQLSETNALAESYQLEGEEQWDQPNSEKLLVQSTGKPAGNFVGMDKWGLFGLARVRLAHLNDELVFQLNGEEVKARAITPAWWPEGTVPATEE